MKKAIAVAIGLGVLLPFIASAGEREYFKCPLNVESSKIEAAKFLLSYPWQQALRTTVARGGNPQPILDCVELARQILTTPQNVNIPTPTAKLP